MNNGILNGQRRLGDGDMINGKWNHFPGYGKIRGNKIKHHLGRLEVGQVLKRVGPLPFEPPLKTIRTAGAFIPRFGLPIVIMHPNPFRIGGPWQLEELVVEQVLGYTNLNVQGSWLVSKANITKFDSKKNPISRDYNSLPHCSLSIHHSMRSRIQTFGQMKNFALVRFKEYWQMLYWK